MIFRINKCSRMESAPANATWYLEQVIITSRIIVIIIKNRATNHNPKHTCSSAPAPQVQEWCHWFHHWRWYLLACCWRATIPAAYWCREQWQYTTINLYNDPPKEGCWTTQYYIAFAGNVSMQLCHFCISHYRRRAVQPKSEGVLYCYCMLDWYFVGSNEQLTSHQYWCPPLWNMCW